MSLVSKSQLKDLTDVLDFITITPEQAQKYGVSFDE